MGTKQQEFAKGFVGLCMGLLIAAGAAMAVTGVALLIMGFIAWSSRGIEACQELFELAFMAIGFPLVAFVVGMAVKNPLITEPASGSQETPS